MKIQIREKLRPFSHSPGTSCVIPKSRGILTAFPTRLFINQHELPLPVTGPVENFTVCQDLERDCVFVFGHSKEGYFKLKVSIEKDGFYIQSQKGPMKSIHLPGKFEFLRETQLERLSLGSHKVQDWDLVKRRKDLKEILPIFYCLGQKVPIGQTATGGTATLLDLPKERKEIESSLLAFFQAGFTQLLVPRLFDGEYQGFCTGKGDGDPFFLLVEGVKVIRSLFFKSQGSELSFLPNLPIHFDAGRMLNVHVEGIGSLDIEWSKKQLKKVCLRASHTKEAIFHLQNEIKRFRVNRSTILDRNDRIEITKNKTYFFDRFQK